MYRGGVTTASDVVVVRVSDIVEVEKLHGVPAYRRSGLYMLRLGVGAWKNDQRLPRTSETHDV